MKRYLLITRRRVPLDRVDEYALLWSQLRVRAESADARAWIFESERAGGEFVEFIEWNGSSATPDFAGDLDSVFPSKESDTWVQTSF